MKTLTNKFLVLDIETSQYTETEIVKDKEIIRPTAVWLSYAYIKLYDTYTGDGLKSVYFREWEKLRNYFGFLANTYCGYKIICYVHNLSYEADFLFKNVSKPKRMLCNSSHKVIDCVLEDYPNIEFRCSFLLTMLSLRKMGELVGLEKLESEYRQIIPKDIVTAEEIRYCERDCDIVALYISKFMIPEWKTLKNVPYTKTGRVRKKFNDFYNQIEAKDKITWDLMPPENCYDLLCNAFRGAITISNPKYTNMIITNVHSFDRKSAYPYEMLSKIYPQNIKRVDHDPTTEYWIAKVRIYDIDTKYHWAWLSRYKMQDYDIDSCEFFNGKLRWGGWIETTITNIDKDIIDKTYNYKRIEYIEVAELYEADKLPDPYFQTLEIFAKRKDELREEIKTIKETDENYLEKQMDYMKAKADFNAIYGMTVQKLMQQEYEIDDNYIWKEVSPPYTHKENKHMRRNFLFGIYITAYARQSLINAIIANCPDTFVYADTDSIKYFGEKDDFRETSSRLPQYLDNIPAFHGLGLFEYEKTYDKFLTFGAKKYVSEINGNISMTVAGLPQTTQITDLHDFHIGKIFHNCKLGKLYLVNGKIFFYNREEEKTYTIAIEDDETKKFLKKNKINTRGGVCLYPVDYTLSITPEDMQTLEYYKNGVTKYE